MHHVLTEVQEARGIVAAHPYFLDMTVFCDAIAARSDILATCMGAELPGNHALNSLQTFQHQRDL